MSASTPAACGVAIEVPLKLAYSLPALRIGLTVESIDTPGAAMSTSEPKFEKDALNPAIGRRYTHDVLAIGRGHRAGSGKVACRGHDHRPFVPRVVGRELRASRAGRGAAQAHADHPRAVVGGPLDGGVDVAEEPIPGVRKYLAIQEGRTGSHRGDAHRVVGVGGDRAGHVGPMVADIIGRRRRGEVPLEHNLSRKVRMTGVDAAIEHGNAGPISWEARLTGGFVPPQSRGFTSPAHAGFAFVSRGAFAASSRSLGA